MIAVRGKTLNGHHRLADGRGRRHTAGPDGAAIDVQRARAALPDAAAELGAGESDLISDHPQQRRLQVRVDSVPRAVDDELERHVEAPWNGDCSREAIRVGSGMMSRHEI